MNGPQHGGVILLQSSERGTYIDSHVFSGSEEFGEDFGRLEVLTLAMGLSWHTKTSFEI